MDLFCFLNNFWRRGLDNGRLLLLIGSVIKLLEFVMCTEISNLSLQFTLLGCILLILWNNFCMIHNLLKWFIKQALNYCTNIERCLKSNYLLI